MTNSEKPGLTALPPELRAWEEAGSYVHSGPHDYHLFVRDVGNQSADPDRTLMLFHGYPESSLIYAAALERLGERFDRIVLFDFLGFGLSDKPTEHAYSIFEHADMALEVWRKLGVRGGHLLAHDMGDSVATELLYRQMCELLPGWFDVGILSCTFTNGNMVMELAQLRVGQLLLRAPYLGALLDKRSSYGMFASQVRSASGTDLLPDNEIELMWAAMHHNGGTRISHKLIRYLAERDRFQNVRWLPAVQSIQIPIHFCWGAEDAVAPKKVAQHLHDEVRPASLLTLLPGVGHFCQQEAPDEWVESVMSFWAR